MANADKIFGADSDTKQNLQSEKEKDELFKQIGQLKVENDWLKKASLIPNENRKAMVDKNKSKLNLCRQCDLVSINRSAFYYTGSQIKDPDLEITRIIDDLYIQDPIRVTRRMSEALKRRGCLVI